MELSKSNLLPIIGFLLLIFFTVLSYIQGSIFLDKLLICGFILSFVFLGRIRYGVQRSEVNSDNQKGRTLSE